MAAAIGVSDERSALVYRHCEQLYRIALLVTGEPTAAELLIERLFAALPPNGDLETALVRELHSVGGRAAQRRPWHYSADATDFARAGIEPELGRVLLTCLAMLSPRDRLIVGLHYLRGLSARDIDLRLADAATASATSRRTNDMSDAAAVLTNVRIALGHALELLPALIGAEVLIALDRHATDALAPAAAAELRIRLHTYPELRDARAGLLYMRQLLMRAIPALFAVAPPTDLLERLLDGPVAREQRPRRQSPIWAQAGLIGLVAMLIAALLTAPTLARLGTAPAPPGPRSAAELVDSAIHRLEQPPLQTGVLHEVYQAAWSEQPPYLIERWYEYAAPHRLRVELRTEDGRPPLLTIASDGHGLVQFRTTNNLFLGNQSNDSLDVHLSPEELAAALPILRELPSPGVYSSSPLDGADISRYFLAAARANKPTILGTTTFHQRIGYIVAYRTNTPLPPPLAIYFRRQSPPNPNRVLLTIDSQTYGLLDVAVLPEGARAIPTRHPWQMQSLAVLDDASASVFQLPDSPVIAQRTGLPSPRGFSASRDQARSPNALLGLLRRPLLIPQALPDPTMRGVILANGPDPTDPANLRLLYDGAFISMVLLPAPLVNDPVPAGPTEQTAGAFKYQLLSSGVQNSDLVVASVYPSAAPGQQMLLMLMAAYATPQEREATVRKVISSLVPLTPANAPSLELQFYPAGG